MNQLDILTRKLEHIRDYLTEVIKELNGIGTLDNFVIDHKNSIDKQENLSNLISNIENQINLKIDEIPSKSLDFMNNVINYFKVHKKLSDTQINHLKSTAKYYFDFSD